MEWPGNVRELKNLIKRMIITSPRSELKITHIDNLAAVWRELMEDVSMPNETQVKTLRGFNDVERRPELLAPFVEEYARRILVIWETRTFHMAENLLSELWSTANV